MSNDRQPSPFIEAFERAIATLQREYDGIRLDVLYTYRAPGGDLRASDLFFFHISEDVLVGGGQALVDEFEQELVEQALLQWEALADGGEVFAPLATDIVLADVRLTRYTAALTVEAGDTAALAPRREGTFVCTVTDDAGYPIEGERVRIELEGAGRIVGTHQVTTDARGQAAFVYEAASTPGDVVFHFRAANLVVTMEGYVRVPSEIEHDAPDRVERLSATRITYRVADAEGLLVGGMEASVRLHAGVGEIVDEEPYRDGRGAFTYLAKPTEGGAVFEIRAGAAWIHIPVAVV